MDYVTDIQRFIDAKLPGVIPSILLLDPAGEQLRLGSTKSRSTTEITPRSCMAGPADHPIFEFAEIEAQNPAIGDAKDLASVTVRPSVVSRQSARGAWSIPVLSKERRILGTMIFFCRALRPPSEIELRFMGEAVGMAAVEIENRPCAPDAGLFSDPTETTPVHKWERNRFSCLIGKSPAMQGVYRLVEKVSEQNFPVLIVGESGTGKELVARSAHYSGQRNGRPFVAVDCSCLVPTLVEAELFGYVRGAFTGATQSKSGLIEAAKDGTLFLDEIGEMPAEMQSKLLRTLQEKELRPVGSTRTVPFSARIIAATNRDLEAAVRKGTFRKDLFFRLNVVQIDIPSLKERKPDIPLLVESFFNKFAGASRPTRSVSKPAMACLMAYDWPGNVRELENTIERAVALGSGPILNVVDLPASLRSGEANAKAGFPNGGSLPLEAIERRAILEAIREAGGDVVAAARSLGIGKTTCYRRLKTYKQDALAS